MIRYAIAALLLCVPTVAHGQVVNPFPVDAATQARIDQAATDAASARSTAQATAAAMPAPANAAPRSETTGAAIGAVTTRYALEDHQHPRLTSTTYAVLDGSGGATVTFSRSFANKPGLNLTETDATAGSSPLVLRGVSWITDGSGRYTGVTIQGSRARMLPTINPLSGTLTLVSGVVTGVNGLVTALTNYDVFGGNAAGAVVSVIAIARSDVASN